MKKLFIVFTAFLISACSHQQKDFAQVKKGMNKNEVISLAGQPTKKNNIGFAEFWVYDTANRTVIFRKDTVYNIITSSEARLDSIEGSMKEAGKDIKEGVKKIEGKADSIADKL